MWGSLRFGLAELVFAAWGGSKLLINAALAVLPARGWLA